MTPGVPVNCSLCQWHAIANDYDAACRLADAHLEDMHRLVPETGLRPVVHKFYGSLTDDTFDALLTDQDRRMLKMLRIKES